MLKLHDCAQLKSLIIGVGVSVDSRRSTHPQSLSSDLRLPETPFLTLPNPEMTGRRGPKTSSDVHVYNIMKIVILHKGLNFEVDSFFYHFNKINKSQMDRVLVPKI